MGNPIDQISDDIATAFRTGAIEDDGAAMKLAVDLLIAAFPDVSPPSGLCSFSVLVGAAFARGVDKAKREG